MRLKHRLDAQASHLVACILVLSLLAACDNTADSSGRASDAGSGEEVQTVELAFTSDPTNAWIEVDGRRVGRTPGEYEAELGTEVSFRVVPSEPYDDYDLYVPYSGTVLADQGKAIDVWVTRTTAEKQEEQRREAEAERRRQSELRAQREAAQRRDACERRIRSADLIVESWTWRKSAGYAIAEGLVTNATGRSLENVLAVVSYKTDSGGFISSGDALIDYTTLLSGQSSPFTVYETVNPAMELASIEFRQMFGGRLATIDREDVDCE